MQVFFIHPESATFCLGSVSHEVASTRHDAGHHTEATLPLYGASSRFAEGGANRQQEEGGGPVCMCLFAIAFVCACVFVCVSVSMSLSKDDARN